jgi:hypothetical protein
MLSLLAEQESTRRDLQQMVQDQGVAGDSQAVEALRSKLNEPITKELRWLLGEDGYADYSAFQKALYYRSAHVDPLAPLFTAARVPLSEAQVAQLVTIVAANNQSVRRGKSDITATSQVNWSGVLQQAGGVLSPEQMQVMQKSQPARPQALTTTLCSRRLGVARTDHFHVHSTANFSGAPRRGDFRFGLGGAGRGCSAR